MTGETFLCKKVSPVPPSKNSIPCPLWGRRLKLSQNSWSDRNRSTINPHPVPLPKGEGTLNADPDCALSFRERVGVRAIRRTQD